MKRLLLSLLCVALITSGQARNPRGTSTGPFIGACPVTSGALTLAVTTPRATGISPFLVFYDATASTDASAANSVAQNVTFTWSFGDSGASGTGTWTYGSNPGANSMNVGSGIVAAHLYRTAGSDTPYTATVTATDGTNTTSCTVAVTAYDPVGSNGFPGTATTCAFNSTLGSGCPAGAAQVTASTVSAALSGFGSNKRVLFKCGDSFSGSSGNSLYLGGVTKWAIDAYGSCVGNQISSGNASTFPQMTGSGTVFSIFLDNATTNNSGDGRIANLNCASTGACFSADYANTIKFVPYQITLYNINSAGTNEEFYWAQGAQMGLVGSLTHNQGANQGTFPMYAGQNPVQWATCTACPFPNGDYQALLGNSFNGAGAPAGPPGVETVRIQGGRFIVMENNLFTNANSTGAVLKVNSKNTAAGTGFTGVYQEYLMITDNLFSGTSGSQIFEFSPENNTSDERGRYLVFERNIIDARTSGGKALISGVNNTVRDNAIIGNGGNPTYAVQVAQRGTEPAPQFVEVYNNSCSTLNTCVGLTGQFYAGNPSNSFAKNNLYYNSGGGTTVVDAGTGDSVSNNTVTVTNNPSWTNGSTTFDLITDWKPTANYTGGVSVPVIYDALGTAWSPTWDWGAVRH